MWKNGRDEQPTYDNMSHAHCVLDNYGYRHTFRICNIIAFPLQQWLRERASIFRCMDIASLVPYRVFKWCVLPSQ